jgi:hypothetical protein
MNTVGTDEEGVRRPADGVYWFSLWQRGIKGDFLIEGMMRSEK